MNSFLGLPSSRSISASSVQRAILICQFVVFSLVFLFSLAFSIRSYTYPFDCDVAILKRNEYTSKQTDSFYSHLIMISVTNLIKFLFVFTLLICCQIQLAASSVNQQDVNDIDFGDDLYEALPVQHHHLHENYRRASLRYQPHVLYKKASLRPIIGQNGKLTFVKRDQV
ncbi:hypothetical protein I4U23_028151 [Adineta vaga]|nr:hypothetical protein I4U23_028151 [Adineta vaga]